MPFQSVLQFHHFPTKDFSINPNMKNQGEQETMSKEAKLGIYASENFRRSCYQQQRSLMRIIARDRQRFMEETGRFCGHAPR